MPPIQILIQQRGTKKFLSTRQTWTKDVNKARLFSAALEAFYYAAESELRDIEIVWLPSGRSTVEAIVNRRSGNVPRNPSNRVSSQSRRNMLLPA